MSKEPKHKPSFSTGRRWNLRLKVLIDIVCVFALIGMVNYLGYRYFARTHWTPETKHELSSLSHKILQTVTNDVKVVVFFDPDQELYDQVSDLIDEYRFTSPRIKLETIDYNRNPTGAAMIKDRYGLTDKLVKDMVIFDSKGKTKMVMGSDLSDLDMSKVMSGESKIIKRTTFKGEMLFTSAIATVTARFTPKAYFTTGHGEHDPTQDMSKAGYSKFGEILALNNVVGDSLNLLQAKKVPDDCGLLIIAGPRSKFSADEVAAVDAYLDKGGRAFMLFNFQSKPNLGSLLERKWGVKVGNDAVLDRENSVRGMDLFTTNYVSHDVMKAVSGKPLHFALPRSISKIQNGPQTADAPQVSELIRTSENGEARGDFEPQTGRYRPNPYKDREGAISIAAAVEMQQVEGTIGSTRILVCGDSFFLNNEMIESAVNRDFAVSSVNWLLDRSFLVGGINPRPIKEYRFELTKQQVEAINWAVLGAIPGGVLCFGFLVWLRRRN